MTGALLYQPNGSWRIGVALGGAAMIHLAAVAVANVHRPEGLTEVSSPPGITEIVFDPISPVDDSTSPPDPTSPSPTGDRADNSLIEESPSPPPIHPHNARSAAPVTKARTGILGSPTVSSARVMALSAPRPEYPYEARRQRITGSGFVVLTIDCRSGNVTAATMEQSTGSSVLDNTAITGFLRWRFKSGTVSRVRLPITFTMTGAQY
jgi:TonB family protein